MRTILLIAVFALSSACSSDPDDPTPTDTGQPDTADMTADVAADDDAGTDAGTEPDTGSSFCATADCGADTPQCSELLQRCVQCTANTDCMTAPLLSCETSGDGGGEPLYECVECVDDTVCGGGTCDLTTHVCVP